jgi:hypothetical protein
MATAGTSQAGNAPQASVENRMPQVYFLIYAVTRWEEGLKDTSFHHYLHKDTNLTPNYTVYDFASSPSHVS